MEKSLWVDAEAQSYLTKVVNAIIEKDVVLKPPFNVVEAAHLEGWNGDRQNSEWRRLVEGTKKKISQAKSTSAD